MERSIWLYRLGDIVLRVGVYFVIFIVLLNIENAGKHYLSADWAHGLSQACFFWRTFALFFCIDMMSLGNLRWRMK